MCYFEWYYIVYSVSIQKTQEHLKYKGDTSKVYTIKFIDKDVLLKSVFEAMSSVKAYKTKKNN